MNLHVSGNDIADAVLRTFDALPNKVKPRRYPDGSREWTTLSGIVLSRCVFGPVSGPHTHLGSN